MKNNSEKWIVGTGFSRGIGFDLVKKIKSYDYKVLHIGRKSSEYDDQFINFDFSEPLSKEFLKTLHDSLNSKNIYGFIYCAGIIPQLIAHESDQQKAEFWKSQAQAMQVNYISCAALSSEVLTNLLQEQKNVQNHTPFLAHISSLAAVDPLPGFELYGITKSSTLKYYEHLSKLYSVDQLECLSIHPGTVQTDMLDNIINETAYKKLPVVDTLLNAQKNNHIISAEKSASLISNFLLNPNLSELRKSAHGKLFVADINQIW